MQSYPTRSSGRSASLSSPMSCCRCSAKRSSLLRLGQTRQPTRGGLGRASVSIAR